MISRVFIPLLLVSLSLNAQTLTRNDAEHFVHDLIWNPDSMNSWFDENSLSTAHRLGIEYQGVVCKNLISYDLEDSLRQLIKQKRLQYSITLDTMEQGYTHLLLRFENIRCPGISILKINEQFLHSLIFPGAGGPGRVNILDSYSAIQPFLILTVSANLSSSCRTWPLCLVLISRRCGLCRIIKYTTIFAGTKMKSNELQVFAPGVCIAWLMML